MGRQLLSLLRGTWEELLLLVGEFLPRLLAMLLLVGVGWLVAAALRALVRRLLGLLGVDSLLVRSGTEALLDKAGMPSAARVAGTLVFWVVWGAFLLSGLRALGVAGSEALAAEFMRFIPRLVAGLVVLAVGFGLSNFLWRVVLLAAVNAHVAHAPLLGALARGLSLVAVVAMALEQIGVGERVVYTAFALTFGSLMLAAAIAFGLGARHLARRFLEERLLRREPPPASKEPSHL